MCKTVAIQGARGAFHEIAARQFFGDGIEVVECETFIDLFETLKREKLDFGIVAIENTIAGSLLQNYAHIKESGLQVLGETSLHIKQNLTALPGTAINDITEVYSHPIAIQQSRVFFKDYPKMKLIESADTAMSVKEIAEKKLKNTAAIGSDLAAELYGLSIIAEGIETNKRNFTRFLIIGNEKALEENGVFKKNGYNKASICFSLPHKEGSLVSILAILSFFDLSLTKIQSLPIIGQEFEYFFYIDFIFDDKEKYKNAMHAIEALSHDLQVLGEYERAGLTLNKD